MNKYDSLYTGLHNDGYEPRISNLTELSTTFTSLLSILEASTTAISTTASYIRSSRVAKAGDTITGNLLLKSPGITLGTTSTTNVYGTSINFIDSTNTNIGYLKPYSLANGYQGVYLEARLNIDNTNQYNTLRLGIKPNGEREVYINSAAKLAWRDALGLDDRVYCYVYYTVSGGGDATFNGWVKWNTIEVDTKNCFDTSTGYFVVPSDGYYLCNFGYYSNSTSVGTGQRPALGLLNADDTRKDFVMCTGNVSMSLSHVWYCQAGEKLAAGTYESGWSINFYRTKNHNYFSILKL